MPAYRSELEVHGTEVHAGTDGNGGQVQGFGGTQELQSSQHQFKQETLIVNSTSRITRRHCLKLAGAAALGTWSVSAEAKHLWTKARKNFRLGIFAHVYGKFPLEEATARIKADGFRSVITNFNFADVRFDLAKPDWEAVGKVRASLERQELAVAGLYGYYNMVAPDAEVRRQGRERMEFLLANWKQFGSPHVTTETGT